MAYIGASGAFAGQAIATDVFSGNGTNTAFTLSKSVFNTKDIEVLVNNVQQNPFDGSYSVSGTTLTFSGAVSSGANNIYVTYRGTSTNLYTPYDNTVTANSLTSTAITGKLGYTPANKAGDTFTGAVSINGTGTIGSGSNNYFTINGSISAGQPAYIAAAGADSNVGIDINTKATGDLRLNTNSTVRLFASGANGNVGIGTSTPVTLLQASKSNAGGDVGLFASQSTDGYTSTSSTATLYLGATYNAIAQASRIVASHSDGTTGDHGQNLQLWTVNSGSTPTERMRITSAGLIGVANTNPNYTLHVTRVSGDTDVAMFKGNVANALIRFQDTGSADFSIGADGGSPSGNSFIIYDRTNSQYRFMIDRNGVMFFNSGYGSAGRAYGCRAWVHFNASNGTINASGNISYVTKNGTADFTIGFSNGMPDGAYTITGSLKPTSGQSGNNAREVHVAYDTYPSTSSFRIRVVTAGAGFEDPEYVFVTVHR